MVSRSYIILFGKAEKNKFYCELLCKENKFLKIKVLILCEFFVSKFSGYTDKSFST